MLKGRPAQAKGQDRCQLLCWHIRSAHTGSTADLEPRREKSHLRAPGPSRDDVAHVNEGNAQRRAPPAVPLQAPGDALEGKGPQRRPQKRLDRRLAGVAKAVGAGYCRLQMPLRLALGVRETVAGHRLGALEGGGGGGSPPLPMHPWQAPFDRAVRADVVPSEGNSAGAGASQGAGEYTGTVTHTRRCRCCRAA